MNCLKQLTVVTILGAMSCIGLPAQSIEMRAKIPFDFQVGNRILPAGEYDVRNESDWIILKRSDGSGVSTAVMTNAALSPVADRGARLQFHRYGDAYFLAQVWRAYHAGRDVVPSDLEKRLAKLSAPAKPVVVAARSR